MATALAFKGPAYLPMPQRRRAKRGEDPFIALLDHYEALRAWSAAGKKAGHFATDDGFEHYIDRVVDAEQLIAKTPGNTAFAAYAKLRCYVHGRRFDESDIAETECQEAVSAFDALSKFLNLPGYESCKPTSEDE